MTLAQNSFISLIKYPILTEKTIQLLQSNQYSFAVDKSANKISIKAAIEELFDVKVVSVNTSLRPLKRRRVGKFIGQKARHKRAIVTLAPENSITFFEEN
jgi:large subunit ribosomal protein L23|tara:strand:+ start:336 stop:635 length:300 start_codon:yes stop_codon:yes gene_type:complete